MVAGHEGPSVLDVGCGPGRVGEAVLAAGAASYVGIDISPRMLVLARARLGGDTRVELLEGDFLGPGLELAADELRRRPRARPLRLRGGAAAGGRAAARALLGDAVAPFTRWDRM